MKIEFGVFMRILGVDYGESRTGLAISDSLGITAQGLDTLFESRKRHVAQQIADIVTHENISTVVLGLPKNMNNTMGSRAKKTLEFARILKELVGVPIVTWDERLTTVSAVHILNQADVRGKKRKKAVDCVAASLILQGYLDYISREK